MTTSKKASSTLLTILHALLLGAAISGCGEESDAPVAPEPAYVSTNDAGASDGASPDATSLACTSNAQCASGFCADGVCCDAACDGTCVSCAQTGKVGTCSPVVGVPDETCGGALTCDEAGRCRAALGTACTSSGDCGSGSCVDGVCCSSAACGTCQSCAVPGSAGACAPVAKFADDPDTCTGAETCNGLGRCQLKNGAACAKANDCVSQQCVDGVCCEQGCNATCYACNQPGGEGRCQPVHGTEDQAAVAACDGARTCSAPDGAAPSCLLKDGQACTANDQCFTGFCATLYLDGDGDGYGGTSTIRRCGKTPPAGYVTRTGDCCDADPGAHPGSYGASSLSACRNYDWNCNGVEELSAAAADLGASCGCTLNVGKFGTTCVVCK